jgi:hypothetical protein
MKISGSGLCFHADLFFCFFDDIREIGFAFLDCSCNCGSPEEWVMLLRSMALCDEDLSITVRSPESSDSISLFWLSCTVFYIFDDVVVCIDNRYEWHRI